MTLVVAGALLWSAGITLEGRDACLGMCEWGAFALLFAGAPVSGAITVLGGSDLVLAWPVDILLWILVGVLHTRLSGEHPPLSRQWNLATVMVLGTALVYGGLLAAAVERA